MPDWDAATYQRLSEPQVAWGREVLERLPLQGHETVIDAGCGTGRLTRELAARLPRGRVLAVDRSASMLDEAARQLADHRGAPIRLVRADVAALPLAGVAHAIFSTAVFHWIADHPRLFRGLRDALVPDGILVAQCGGGPNLARLLDRARRLAGEPRFAPYFTDWTDPWHFADDWTTAERLLRAGFVDVETSVEPAPVLFPDAAAYRAFLSCVCVRHHLDRLPVPERDLFTAALADQAAADDPPFTLDYWRLNLSGRRAER
jgi:trans-aconitate 2-methyltransferase